MGKRYRHFRVGSCYRAISAIKKAVFVSFLGAQTAAAVGPGYALHHIGEDAGLMSAGVRAIAQGPSGLLWVGTESGLYRYDGTEFDLLDPPLGHGVVNSIRIDSHGRVWTSWYSRPTTVFDPATKEWVTLAVIPPRSTPLGFLEDPLGRIWLSDGAALYQYDADTKVASVILELNSDPRTVTTHELVWHAGTIWLADAKEVIGIDADSGSVRKRQAHAADPPIAIRQTDDTVWFCHTHLVRRENGSGAIEVYYENIGVDAISCNHDADGNLWIGTAQAGALQVISVENVVQHRHDGSDRNSIADGPVLRAYLDRSGRQWLVTPGRVSLFENNRFYRFTFDPGESIAPRFEESEKEILEDRSGAFWFGTTNDGMARLSKYATDFETAVPPTEYTSSRMAVLGGTGDLWIGMDRGGVYRWNRDQDRWRHYSANLADPNELPTDQVRTVLSTATGELYAGSNLAILSRYNDKIDGWDRIDLGGLEPIYTLLELPDGRIVIGRRLLVSVFDPETTETNDFPLSGSANVRATTISSSGRVWVGTQSGQGLLELGPDQGILRSWPEKFSALNILSLYEDSAGSVWIGSWGRGLIRFNPQTGRTQSITGQGGLIGHTIVGILPGRTDELWVASEKGLARIQNCVTAADTCQPLVTRYDVNDGLSNRWFNGNSASASPRGELFFGGPNGVDFFHPDFLDKNPTPPSVSLIEVSLNGALLPGIVGIRDEPIRLPYRFGKLEIRFAAIDFHNPDENQYRYRFDDQDAWVSLGNSNRMTLRNLNWGLHRLQISGSNNDGLWSPEPISLTLAVARPAYLGWQAITLYIFMAALLLILFNRYRDRRMRSYASKLEHQVEQRTEELHKANRAMSEFYANVSHEVRTPLALIVSSAERLQKTLAPDEYGSFVSAIRRHSGTLSRYVDGLITVSQLESSDGSRWVAEDARKLLKQMINDYRPLAGDRCVELVHSPDDAVRVRTQRNALNTIFSNLMINAIKHTAADGVIRISIFVTNLTVEFSIEDDGPGVKPEIRDKIFDRGVLYSSVSGYGIGLHLVRQTVMAIGGEISIEDSELGGACFRVTMRLAGSDLPANQSISETALVADHRYQPTPVSHYSTSNSSRPTLLIIEDHAELRHSICAVLERKFVVLQAAGVEKAVRIAAEEIPDIVLCDVMLPDGSGFDILQRVKDDSLTDHIPVVLLTALADEDNRIEGLKHRADAYLTKPFRREVLETTLENLIRDRRNTLRHAASEVWDENWHDKTISRRSHQTFSHRFMVVLASCHSNPANGVDALAEGLAMSRRALERKTKQYFDKSPNELLVEFRLRRAAGLLRDGARISDVYLTCGFNSHSYFGASFKKHYGCAPRKYAARHSETN